MGGMLKSVQRYTLFAAVMRVVIFISLVILLSLASDWGAELLESFFEQWEVSWGLWALTLALPVYIVLLSIPFVPGIEIGLALLMVFGVDVVAFVYIGTLMALSLSFYAGRAVPLSVQIRIMVWLHLQKAALFMSKLEGVERKYLIDVLLNHSPHRIIPFLVRHRYLALVLLLNLPGNALIGGGGGIGLIAGLSRLFSYPNFLLTVSLAVAPVPILFLWLS